MVGKFKTLAEVPDSKTEWLWQPYIPYCGITVVTAHPATGKSTFILNVSARVTMGEPMPFSSSRSTAGSVIYLAAEDEESEIKKRFLAANGDIERLFVVDSDAISLPDDIDDLEEIIRLEGVRLVVIDPLESFVDGSITSRTAMRRVLDPLNRLAQKYGVAIVGIRHLNKTSSQQAINRGAGSMAITAAARSELLVAGCPYNPEHRVIVHTKCNLGPRSRSVEFRLTQVDESAKVEWVGYCDVTVDEAINSACTREQPQLENAKQVLFSILGEGPVLATEAIRLVRNAGVSPATVRRAKEGLQVESIRVGFGRKAVYYWELPDRNHPRVARFWDAEISSLADQLFHGESPSQPPNGPDPEDVERDWEIPDPDDDLPEKPA